MFDISFWKFILPGVALLLLVFILLARGFGVIKLEYLNLKWLRELQAFKLHTDDPAYKGALVAIISHTKSQIAKNSLG